MSHILYALRTTLKLADIFFKYEFIDNAVLHFIRLDTFVGFSVEVTCISEHSSYRSHAVLYDPILNLTLKLNIRKRTHAREGTNTQRRLQPLP